MKTTRVPVLIVGAGAAGTLLTLELARRSVRVRTIDRLAKPAGTSRALALHARTLEIFERLDRRLIERYLDRGIRGKGYVLHCVDAGGRRSERRPAIDFTKLDSRYPYMLLSRQSETEQYLREYTGAHYGVSPDWNAACVAVQQDGEGVVATLDVGGVPEQVRCDYLVGCDGAESIVRKAIGEDERGAAGEHAGIENLDVYLNGFPDDEEYVHHCVGDGHFLTVVKLPGGFHRLSRADRGAAPAPGEGPEAGFQQLIDQHFDGVTLGKPVWHSKWRSAAPSTAAYRRGRIFVAGDSAFAQLPASEQGVNCSMQDVHNLGWKLAFVVKGLARPALLDTYETERRPVATQALAAAAAMREALASCDVAPRGPDASVLAGVAVTYRKQSEQGDATLPGDGPAPGDRAPDVELNGGRTLFALTRHPRYTLFALPANEKGGHKMALELKPLVHRFKAVVEFHALAPAADLARRYGESTRDRLLLLRPDGHVAFRCVATDVPRLEAHLTERFAL
jgi:2-polyprenyl-6-methoxyphenol hydroxylase-like FAD-dependent oxidoreductase